MKRFCLHTLGCKVNQYESQAMREALVRAGFEETDSKRGADIYVLNTCTVTEKADRESRYMLNRFRRANSAARIVVTGCYVEQDSDEIASMPGVTHIIRNRDKHRIASLLDERRATKDERLAIGFPYKITHFKDRAKAFVKIQDGCDNSCAYCKVPLARGPSVSRPLEEILDEARGLVDKGYKELVFTGICLGSWGEDLVSSRLAAGVGLGPAGLADLLKAVLAIAGDFRVRLSSIEPNYVTDELIDLMGRERRICRHLHIPLQSGDDRVLRRMKRPYDTAEFYALIEKIRGKIDGVAVTTDVMIGFPGETEDDFINSLNFVRALSPSRTHIFNFSRRPGTAAYNMSQTTDFQTMKRRHREMEGAALNASYLFRRRYIGKVLNVLVESRRDRDSGLLSGYSDNYVDILFPGPDGIMGRIVPVRIVETDPVRTIGRYE